MKEGSLFEKKTAPNRKSITGYKRNVLNAGGREAERRSFYTYTKKREVISKKKTSSGLSNSFILFIRKKCERV